ncbi:MAG: AAA family ATPase [Verrucomicrobiota bacterium JB023]|nr:AAA family ATPase [Verrucomicrobiota bacterium JB023]
MATLIPEKPSGTTTPAVARLFRILKKLPDSFTVWHNFSPDQPHFLVLNEQHQAFLIHVAETSEELARSAIQLDLLADAEQVSPDTLASGEVELLASFPLPSETTISRLLVFPNATQDTLDQITMQRSQHSEVRFLGLERQSPDDFIASLEQLAGKPLPEPKLFKIRAQFTPESVIPTHQRPTLIERERASSESPIFLDLDQEKLFKQDLLLPPPGEDLTSTSRLVTGPAGSGKSLVLLHRAILAARLNEGARMLILTHNRPISVQLKERFRGLVPQGAKVEWRTFFSWATSIIRPAETVIGDGKFRNRLALLKATRPDLGKFTVDFLADELDYLRDLGVRSKDAYLSLERSGRLTALQAPAREAIWQLLVDYRHELERDKLLDWPEVALRFEDQIRQAPEKLAPGYDFIFIDEAQFFAKIWFAPVLSALKGNGQLFLSADHTQGFLKRRQTWRDLGIDIIGRAHRLGRVYRSTRPVASAARNFFLNRQPVSAEKDLADIPDLLTPEDIAKLPEGESIHFFRSGSKAQAVKKAAELVRRQLEASPRLRGNILVIEADSSRLAETRDTLRTELGAGTVHYLQAKSSERPPDDPCCRLSSLNAATGLEATSVILLGLDTLLEKEGDPTLSAEAAAELRHSQTRLIYVALTRAIARLSIVTERSDQWKNLLGLAAKKSSGPELCQST